MSKSKSSPEGIEPKAKDIMNEYATRPTLVERLCARLRPLRPPVCTSKRFFDYFELPDPYHPIDFAKEYRPDVGPSVLILGENRRPVAPHAKVPPLKSRIESVKPRTPQSFMPQGVPKASTRSASPPPPPPIPKKGSGEFGGKSQHPLHKLPVRPDLAQAQQNSPMHNSSSTQTPINRSIPKPQSTSTGTQSRTGNLRMRRSMISNSQPKVTPLPSTSPPSTSSSELSPPYSDTPATTATVNRSPSAASGDGGLDDLFGFGAQEGRMKIPRRSVQRTSSDSTSTQTSAVQSTVTKSESGVTSQTAIPPQSESSPSKIVRTPPVNRSPSAASGGGGLDDLFGFGAQEGRMKIPKRSQRNDSTSPTQSSPRAVFDRNPVQPPEAPKK